MHNNLKSAVLAINLVCQLHKTSVVHTCSDMLGSFGDNDGMNVLQTRCTLNAKHDVFVK